MQNRILVGSSAKNVDSKRNFPNLSGGMCPPSLQCGSASGHNLSPVSGGVVSAAITMTTRSRGGKLTNVPGLTPKNFMNLNQGNATTTVKLTSINIHKIIE